MNNGTHLCSSVYTTNSAYLQEHVKKAFDMIPAESELLVKFATLSQAGLHLSDTRSRNTNLTTIKLFLSRFMSIRERSLLQ